MTAIQKFFLKILPKSWGESMQRESQLWQIRCDGCNRSRSIWDAGGIRWNASSKGKRMLVKCSQCGGLRMAHVERKPAQE